MRVKIYQPTKTAMQSGRAKTRKWVLEPDLPTKRQPEPLMGWVSSGDTLNQVKLDFETKEEAIAYAKRAGYQFTVASERRRVAKSKSYAENFSFNRVGRWTH